MLDSKKKEDLFKRGPYEKVGHTPQEKKPQAVVSIILLCISSSAATGFVLFPGKANALMALATIIIASGGAFAIMLKEKRRRQEARWWLLVKDVNREAKNAPAAMLLNPWYLENRASVWLKNKLTDTEIETAMVLAQNFQGSLMELVQTVKTLEE